MEKRERRVKDDAVEREEEVKRHTSVGLQNNVVSERGQKAGRHERNRLIDFVLRGSGRKKAFDSRKALSLVGGSAHRHYVRVKTLHCHICHYNHLLQESGSGMRKHLFP